MQQSVRSTHPGGQWWLILCRLTLIIVWGGKGVMSVVDCIAQRSRLTKYGGNQRVDLGLILIYWGQWFCCDRRYLRVPLPWHPRCRCWTRNNKCVRMKRVTKPSTSSCNRLFSVAIMSSPSVLLPSSLLKRGRNVSFMRSMWAYRF